MAVYLINSYDIRDMEDFKTYPPKVYPLLIKYVAEVLSSDIEAISLEGKAKTMNAIIKFPSKEAVFNCYNDSEYQEIKKIRHRSTDSCSMVIVKEYILNRES